jgi:hypothetical protein
LSIFDFEESATAFSQSKIQNRKSKIEKGGETCRANRSEN